MGCRAFHLLISVMTLTALACGRSTEVIDKRVSPSPGPVTSSVATRDEDPETQKSSVRERRPHPFDQPSEVEDLNPSNVDPGKLAMEKSWVKHVSLGSEYGKGKRRVSKWTRSPTLTVMGGDKSHRKLLATAVGELNRVLDETGIAIEWFDEGDQDADIQVYFAPRDDFAQLARDHGCTYVEGNAGFFCYFPGSSNEITRALILISKDLDEDFGLHMVLEELTQVMGFGNDATEYPDSIFYETPSDTGYATKLSRLDCKLVKFIYLHVEPGADEWELDEAFDRYWSLMD